MDEPKDIVKANLDSYNKKLLFQDSILVISILFILINYFLLVEPNYYSLKELTFRNEKIQKYNDKINSNKQYIFNIIPDSAKNSITLNDSDFTSEQAIEKINPYLENKDQVDSVQTKISNIKSAITNKEILSGKNEDLKKKISESKDALSLVKVFLFINDGREHFALFLSFVISIFIVYFYATRRYLLNLLTRTLRIQKEKVHFNEFYEYSVNYSIWLTPVPSKTSYSISADELLCVLSIKNTHKLYKIVMAIFFILLVILQFRIYFIELRINELYFNLYSSLCFINCILVSFICYLWLTRKSIPDNLNSEEVLGDNFSRRDFILFSASIFPIFITALGIPALKYFGQSSKSSKLYNRLVNNPRFISNIKNKNTVKDKNIEFENQCLHLTTTKQYDECVNKLITEIKKKINNTSEVKNNQAIRLTDLLTRVLMFLIYRQQENKYNLILDELIEISKKSTVNILKDRSAIWSQPNYKWSNVCQNKKAIIKWNKTIFD